MNKRSDREAVEADACADGPAATPDTGQWGGADRRVSGDAKGWDGENRRQSGWTTKPGGCRAVLRASEVTKVYQLENFEVRALDGVSMDVCEGEMLSIMGPSGSGKSTLMHIIGLLDQPTSGTMCIEGERIGDLTPNQLSALRNKHIGFVVPAFNLLARTSAQANVELPLVYAGVSGADREKRARGALEDVELGDRLRNTPAQLSGGQQQRVAIARALVTKPSIVLADEPTGNLDSRSGVEVLALLQALNRTGITVVIVTHDANVARHSQRIVELRDGLIVSDAEVVDRLDAREEMVTLGMNTLGGPGSTARTTGNAISETAPDPELADGEA
jgi:putative ABC transport system ATP-binding protein